MNILIDSSTLHHAVAIKGAWVDTGVKLWGGKIPIQTGFLKSIEAGHKITSTKGGEQTRFIAALRPEFLKGKLKAHTTDLLSLERTSQPSGRFSGMNYGDASLFNGVKLVSHKTLDFLVFSIPKDDPISAIRAYLAKSKDVHFQRILAALNQVKPSPNHTQDAWHLASAQRLEMDVFLTTDTTLIGQIKSMQDKELREALLKVAMLPSTFCEKIGIKPLEDTQFQKMAQSISPFQFG